MGTSGPRQQTRERAADRDEHAQGPGQKARDAARQLFEVAPRDTQVFGPRHPVDEADRKVEPHRVVQQRAETCSARVGLHSLGLTQPLPHEADGGIGIAFACVARACGSVERHGYSLALAVVREKW